MSSTRSIELPWATVYANTTTARFVPVTAFMSALRVAKLRAMFEVRHLLSPLQVTPAYQTANVESSPDQHNTFGSGAGSEGVTYAASFTDVSGNTGNKRLVRFGWEVKNTTGSAQTLARVAGSFDVQEPG